MTCTVQEYILGFKITVDDTIGVKILQSKDYLGCVEPCSFLTKTNGVLQVPEQFTSVTKIYNEIQFIGSLKGVMKINYKWRINVFQNIFFYQSTLLIFLIGQSLLSDDLHSI